MRLDALALPTLGRNRVIHQQRRLQCGCLAEQNNIRQYHAITTVKQRTEQRQREKTNKDVTKEQKNSTAWRYLSTACEARCYLSCLKVFLSTWHLRLELVLPADWHFTCNTLAPQRCAGLKVNTTARRIDLYPRHTRRHARKVTCTHSSPHSRAEVYTCMWTDQTHTQSQ